MSATEFGLGLLYIAVAVIWYAAGWWQGKTVERDRWEERAAGQDQLVQRDQQDQESEVLVRRQPLERSWAVAGLPPSYSGAAEFGGGAVTSAVPVPALAVVDPDGELSIGCPACGQRWDVSFSDRGDAWLSRSSWAMARSASPSPTRAATVA
jgi:hypothetical protein